jgi:hypothetical protein
VFSFDFDLVPVHEDGELLLEGGEVVQVDVLVQGGSHVDKNRFIIIDFVMMTSD